MLYLIPTPIGNLKDITYRAVELLSYCDYILCEDTRVSKKLLQAYDIETPLQSYHAHNEHQKTDMVIKDLQFGMNIALISDAGQPGISDPGFLLMREVHAQDIPFTVLPGPSALTTALVGSGLPMERFVFEGFLPHKKGRQARFKEIAERDLTTVLFESPHRLLKTLTVLQEFCGAEREICVARELTKLHETYHRGTVSELIAQFEQMAKIKGEIVLVISGKKD
jgi:16S rRNA (cytidine1402-2'-O)-methyltransferase